MRVSVSQFSLRNCIADKRSLLRHSHIEPVLGQLELYCAILKRLLSSCLDPFQVGSVLHQIQPTQIPSGHECISMAIYYRVNVNNKHAA